MIATWPPKMLNYKDKARSPPVVLLPSAQNSHAELYVGAASSGSPNRVAIGDLDWLRSSGPLHPWYPSGCLCSYHWLGRLFPVPRCAAQVICACDCTALTAGEHS